METMSPYQEVVLVCEECNCKSDKDSRDELVDKGWNWQEFEIDDAGIERVAHCPDCFDSDKLLEAIEEYRKNRLRDNKTLEEAIQ